MLPISPFSENGFYGFNGPGSGTVQSTSSAGITNAAGATPKFRRAAEKKKLSLSLAPSSGTFMGQHDSGYSSMGESSISSLRAKKKSTGQLSVTPATAIGGGWLLGAKSPTRASGARQGTRTTRVSVKAGRGAERGTRSAPTSPARPVSPRQSTGPTTPPPTAPPSLLGSRLSLHSTSRPKTALKSPKTPGSPIPRPQGTTGRPKTPKSPVSVSGTDAYEADDDDNDCASTARFTSVSRRSPPGLKEEERKKGTRKRDKRKRERDKGTGSEGEDGGFVESEIGLKGSRGGGKKSSRKGSKRRKCEKGLDVAAVKEVEARSRDSGLEGSTKSSQVERWVASVNKHVDPNGGFGERSTTSMASMVSMKGGVKAKVKGKTKGATGEKAAAKDHGPAAGKMASRETKSSKAATSWETKTSWASVKQAKLPSSSPPPPPLQQQQVVHKASRAQPNNPRTAYNGHQGQVYGAQPYNNPPTNHGHGYSAPAIPQHAPQPYPNAPAGPIIPPQNAPQPPAPISFSSTVKEMVKYFTTSSSPPPLPVVAAPKVGARRATPSPKIAPRAATIRTTQPLRSTDRPGSVPTSGGVLRPGVGQIIGRWYKLEQELGSGTYASVWKGHHIKSGWAVAVKIPKVGPRDHNYLSIEKEVLILKILKKKPHRNVIQLLSVVSSGNNQQISVARLMGETLNHHATTGGMARGELPEVGRQILAGLAHIHALGLVHGDLKAENIVRDPVTAQWVIIDFGAGRGDIPGNPDPAPFRSTMHTAAPEAWVRMASLSPPYTGYTDYEEKKYGVEDVFSLGLELLRLANVNPKERVYQIQHHNIEHPNSRSQAEFVLSQLRCLCANFSKVDKAIPTTRFKKYTPASLGPISPKTMEEYCASSPTQLAKIMKALLNPDPNRRMTSGEIQKEGLLQGEW